MNDQLIVKGLRLSTHVGVTAEERAAPQSVIVDVVVATNLAAAGRSDDLAETIDYAALISSIAQAVESGEANLLESLAQRVVATVESIKEATGVTVEVWKEIVPIEEEVDRVSVRIERQFR